MKHASIPTNPSEQKFDRGTGTGEPTAETARLLNLMKQVDDAFNLRDYDRFLEQLHSEELRSASSVRKTQWAGHHIVT